MNQRPRGTAPVRDATRVGQRTTQSSELPAPAPAAGPAANEPARAANHVISPVAPAAAADVVTLTSGAVNEEQVDEQLVTRAQKGDKRAFDLLVRKYQFKIVQLVERLVGDADALDVAQETFVKAYRALNGFRGQSQFYTWLYRIAINTSKNYLVARKRRPASQDIDVQEAELYGHTEQMADVETPERLILSEEIRRKVGETIAALPADLRQAITLRELEGLSYEEIAEVMDCPIGTVRSRIFRAREAIDAVIQPLMQGS